MKAKEFFQTLRKARLSLAARLIGLVVLIALISGAVVATVTIRNIRKSLYDRILSEKLADVDFVGGIAHRFIEAAQISVLELAGRPSIIRAVVNNTPEQVEPELTHFLKINTRLDSASIYDTKGIGWASGVMNWPQRSRSIADREWFQQVIATGKPYLGVPVVSRATRKPVAPYGVPIIDDKGLVRGVLAAGIPLARLSEAMTSSGSNSAERRSLADLRQGGIIVAHRNPDRILKPVGGDEEALRLLLAGKRESLEIRDSAGQAELAVFSPVPGLPWAARILLPIDEVFAPVAAMTRQLIFSVVAVLLLTGAMGWWLANWLTRPLIQLRDAVRSLAAGDKTDRVDFPQAHEIGELGRAFNQMAETIVAREKDLHKANEELEQRVLERTTELEATNKELGAFSYSVSHDLRAPLRSIDGFSQALLEDYANKLDGKGKDYLNRVRESSQHMAQLIDDMLNLSRVTRSEMRLETADLSSLAKAITAELKKSEPERQVEFVIAEGIFAKGDERLLRVALENLLGNAWNFTGKHPRARIEFGTEQTNGEQVYYVRDDGAGFDMAYADKLFGAFQRLHGRTDFPGTGIGLATVQRIINRHGGRVWAEGKVEKGATFYFTLP